MFTKHFDRYGIEIKIDSVQEDGTQSWMVLSSGFHKYVNDLAVDHTKLILCDEPSSSTEKFVPMKQRTEVLKTSSSSSFASPIKQRNWKDMPSVPRVTTAFVAQSRK